MHYFKLFDFNMPPYSRNISIDKRINRFMRANLHLIYLEQIVTPEGFLITFKRCNDEDIKE